MYMEESGDMRASSVNLETRQALLKAVHHLETLSSFPVEKVIVTCDFPVLYIIC